jgi:rhamnose transport system permease protein
VVHDVATPSARTRLRSLLSVRETPIVGALLLALILATFLVENFATGRNVSFLLLNIAAIAMMALPLTLIIVTAEIDLSIASNLALTSALMATLWTSGMPIESIIPICLAAGALMGAFNGVLVTVVGLPSLVVTIGTLALYRGLAYVLLGDQAVASYPSSWVSGARAPLPGTDIPWIALAIAMMAVIFAVVLLTAVADLVVRHLFQVFERRAARTERVWDDALADSARRPARASARSTRQTSRRSVLSRKAVSRPL